MVSAISVSPTASIEPHLHLDPSLQMKDNSKFTCLFISCCFKTQNDDHRRYVYCDKTGCVKEFDMNVADDVEGRISKTNTRIAHLVSEKKHLESVYEETGVDLITKVSDTKPITVSEIKKVVKEID